MQRTHLRDALPDTCTRTNAVGSSTWLLSGSRGSWGGSSTVSMLRWQAQHAAKRGGLLLLLLLSSTLLNQRETGQTPASLRSWYNVKQATPAMGAESAERQVTIRGPSLHAPQGRAPKDAVCRSAQA
jgi:hypothetical protein